MRILVVDDEEAVRLMLEQSLKAESFAVDTASDGEKGSYLARTNDYDLIVLDNRLPFKDGRSVCAEIRQAGKTMPIIIVSVLSEALTKVDLLNAGADDYMIKPFSFQELMARIRALLRRPAVLESEVLKLDTLTLNTKSHLVERGDTGVYLTRKEYMLLEYMLRNQGAVLSRGMLMEHVWDMNIDPFSNTIESHILSLRRKIDTAGETKLIHTVPGRGYKMDIKKY